MTTDTLQPLVSALDAEAEKEWKSQGYTHERDKVHAKERQKFIAIDIGGSGAWLVEKTTGEIYNISGYGRPDHNKKRKSDIGNVATVDAARMFRMRYNYLR